MQGLDSLGNLRVLDVTGNRISAFVSLSNLTKLEDLWAEGNCLSSLPSLAGALALLSETLTCISFRHNPVFDIEGYEQAMKRALPKLQEMDSQEAG